jgi:beta-mannanase
MSSRWACLNLVLGSLPFFFVNCSDGFKASHVIALAGCCSEDSPTNVQWVWSVLAWESKPFGGTNDIELKNIYPGDDFVDWIGIECYNFASDAEWKSCSDRAQGIYAEASALFATKPLMLAEMGAHEHARKADWMSETFDPLDANSVIQRLPRVRALMYWNDNRNDFGQLWINSSSASVTSFRNAIHSPLYYSPMQ